MADDFYTEAAQQRLNQIEAAKAHAAAALQSAKADNDTYSATEAVQLIADLNAQEQNLRRLHQQHVASQTPRAPLPQTEGEFLAKRPERMDYNDVLQMTAKSKYGAVTPEELQKQVNELHRLKGLGQYKD